MKTNLKTNLWLTVLTLALVLNLVMTHTPASGDDCTPGIRKEHLDTTPGAFVDNTTIEINSTNGLQVKDAGITAAKIANLLPTSYTGQQSVTLPNGLIMKFGRKAVTINTPVDIDFQESFNGTPLCVQLQNNYATDVYWAPTVLTYAADKIRIYPKATGYMFWFAIGY